MALKAFSVGTGQQSRVESMILQNKVEYCHRTVLCIFQQIFFFFESAVGKA